MREDEMEALLRLDGAGLEVNDISLPSSPEFRADIRFPADFNNTKVPTEHQYMFSGFGVTRQEAVANVWQKYQEFMQSKTGVESLQIAGQLMFRI